jgi:hypothetical protein
MKKSTGLLQVVGFAVTSLGGTLLHFLFEWLDGALWIAPFSAVNESTWEHMKLLFWPSFIYAIIQSRFFLKRKDFWCIKLRSILLGLILIPIIFYTYNGVIAHSPDWVNISIFFISSAIMYIYEARQFNVGTMNCKYPPLSFAALLVIALLFIIFTFKTPSLYIFKDPLTSAYGI